MPGIATEGKLFFNFFLKDLAGAGGAASAEKRRLSPHDVPVSGLAGYMASRQENNPAEMVATARRIRRAPPGQNRGGGDSERVRPHLRNRA
jgi:hypothetical protein